MDEFIITRKRFIVVESRGLVLIKRENPNLQRMRQETKMRQVMGVVYSKM